MKPTQMELLGALDVLRRFLAADSSAEPADPWVDAANAEVPQRTIRAAVRAGKLDASRAGGKLLVRRSELDRFIAAGRVRAAANAEPSVALRALGTARRA